MTIFVVLPICFIFHPPFGFGSPYTGVSATGIIAWHVLLANAAAISFPRSPQHLALFAKRHRFGIFFESKERKLRWPTRARNLETGAFRGVGGGSGLSRTSCNAADEGTGCLFLLFFPYALIFTRFRFRLYTGVTAVCSNAWRALLDDAAVISFPCAPDSRIILPKKCIRNFIVS